MKRTLMLMVLLTACGNSNEAKSEDTFSTTASGKAEKNSQTPIAEAPTNTVNSQFIPLDALAEFDHIELDANAPCSETIEAIRPLFAEIAQIRSKLTKATDNTTAVQLLRQLSTTLSEYSQRIASRNESNELRRTSDELIASLRDLAESLELSGDAITANNTQAAATMIRRIHNGVTNTRTSLEGLIQLCYQ